MTEVAEVQQVQLWCSARKHPWVTYNPWLDRSYCRCGHRQGPGEQPMDWDAKWSLFHDHPFGEPCSCYLRESRSCLTAAS